ncbi:MAG: MogA/MoaB family molybdenum cofactor biosynthesis protein [Phycisphaeraceae bacterium]
MTVRITAAVLTVSDRCSRGESEDTAGPAVAQLLRDRLNAEVVGSACVPDDMDQIGEWLRHWASVDPLPNLIFTAGGTGLGPRDVTPEATLGVIERQHPGLIQLAYTRTAEKTVRTFLSRGVAGTLGETLIVNLPGSKKGATEWVEALLDVLPHAVATMQGGGHS